MLMASSGGVTADHSRFDCQDLVMSTCKIKKAGIGGPLIDVDGSFVGMNFYDKKATPFLPTSKILELLHVSVWTGSLEVIDYVGKPNRWPVPKPYLYHFLLDEKYSVRNRRRPRKGWRDAEKKEGCSDHTGSLNKRQKACKSGRKNSVLHLDNAFEEQFGSLHN